MLYGYKIDRKLYKNLFKNKDKTKAMLPRATEATTTFPCPVAKLKGGTYCQYHYQIMAKANKYKITPLQVLELYKKTNCNICNAELNKKSCIDHNHITMQVRGVLCNNCNVIIGLAKEDKKILKNIIKYLKKYDK